MINLSLLALSIAIIAQAITIQPIGQTNNSNQQLFRIKDIIHVNQDLSEQENLYTEQDSWDAVTLTNKINQYNAKYDQADAPQPPLFPQPISLSYNKSAIPYQISPCQVRYVAAGAPKVSQIQELVSFYLIQVFNCPSVPLKPTTLNIRVTNTSQKTSNQTSQERYSLILRLSGKWELTADNFVGFLRGMESYAQMFQEGMVKSEDSEANKDRTNYRADLKPYYINGLPIIIDDQPAFAYRGLMIDTSRHFLSLQAIRKIIDGLMFSKLNVLHWHIIDQQSFPLVIDARPQLSQYGSLSGQYTTSDIKYLVQYAASRGVRIVPEIDTPAHSDSWGRNPQVMDMVVHCGQSPKYESYQGQFDPAINITYQVLDDVMKHINTVFPDEVVHFGGDQIDENCWNLKPSIRTWMDANNMTTYRQLEIYYRKRQKSEWKKINPNKKVAYWANKNLNLPLDDDDIIHWWGSSTDVKILEGRPNKIILSNVDQLYLDIGFGSLYGGTYGNVYTWRKVYKFSARNPNINVIGAVACQWGQITDEYNFQQKGWVRTAAFSERVWNDAASVSGDLISVARRLVAWTRSMRRRGFKIMPVSVNLCESQPEFCFK